MNNSPGPPADDYAEMVEAGFYFINKRYIRQAFLCAASSIFGNVPPPPAQYANLVAPFQEYLSGLLTKPLTPDGILEFLNSTEADRHQIIFNFIRTDFGGWLDNHPVPDCPTREATLWSLYRLLNDVRWYIELQMWNHHVLSAASIRRLAAVQNACIRFGHPLTELPKVMPAIVSKNTMYLEGCFGALAGEAATTFQHFCSDEERLKADIGAKISQNGENAKTEAQMDVIIGLLNRIHGKVDSIALDTAATRTDLSTAFQEGALRDPSTRESDLEKLAETVAKTIEKSLGESMKTEGTAAVNTDTTVPKAELPANKTHSRVQAGASTRGIRNRGRPPIRRLSGLAKKVGARNWEGIKILLNGDSKEFHVIITGPNGPRNKQTVTPYELGLNETTARLLLFIAYTQGNFDITIDGEYKGEKGVIKAKTHQWRLNKALRKAFGIDSNPISFVDAKMKAVFHIKYMKEPGIEEAKQKDKEEIEKMFSDIRAEK